MDLTPDKAAHAVLHACGDSRATEPGRFFRLLVEAALHADHENLMLIGVGFPNVADAVDTYKNVEDGNGRLQEVAGLSVPATK